MKRIVLLFSAFIAAGSFCQATAPMVGFAPHFKFSPNMQYRADCDPSSGIKVTERLSGKGIWQMPQFYNIIALSDDGMKLVGSFDRGQTVADPKKVSEDVALLSFYKEGKLIKEIRFKDLFPGKRMILENGNFFSWGAMIGFNNEGFLEARIDGKTVIYDADTGNLRKPE